MWEFRDHINTQASYHPPGTPYTYQGPKFKRSTWVVELNVLYETDKMSQVSTAERIRKYTKDLGNAGHWKATGRILGNFLWKILYKNLDLKGGGTGAGEGTLSLYPPFKIQIFV